MQFYPNKAKFPPKKLAENISKAGLGKKNAWDDNALQWRGSLVAVSGSGLSPVPGRGSRQG